MVSDFYDWFYSNAGWSFVGGLLIGYCIGRLVADIIRYLERTMQ